MIVVGFPRAPLTETHWGVPEGRELGDVEPLIFGPNRRKRRLDPVGEAGGAIVLAHLGDITQFDTGPGTGDDIVLAPPYLRVGREQRP